MRSHEAFTTQGQGGCGFTAGTQLPVNHRQARREPRNEACLLPSHSPLVPCGYIPRPNPGRSQGAQSLADNKCEVSPDHAGRMDSESERAWGSYVAQDASGTLCFLPLHFVSTSRLTGGQMFALFIVISNICIHLYTMHTYNTHTHTG